MDGTLYDSDFYAWTREQAAALRAAAATARTNLPIDWNRVAEEIESLGNAERRELASRLGTIIEHFLKLQLSTSAGPRRGWIETVVRSRREIARIVRNNPSLRRELPELLSAEVADTVELVRTLLREHGEATPATEAQLQQAAFTMEQVLDDWFPAAAEDEREAGAERRP